MDRNGTSFRIMGYHVALVKCVGSIHKVWQGNSAQKKGWDEHCLPKPGDGAWKWTKDLAGRSVNPKLQSDCMQCYAPNMICSLKLQPQQTSANSISNTQTG